MDNMIKETTLKEIGSMRIDIEEFIKMYNNKEAVLVDVRMPVETKVWSLGFGLKIPYNELPDRLDELPSDKLIVCVCPNEYRSNMAKEYLRYKGYNVKNLSGGLLGLAERLKGGAAKDIEI